MVRMAYFNSDFWEISVDFDKLAEFDTKRALWYETDEERESRWMREDRQEQLMPELMEIIEDELTAKQRQAVILYFFEQKTQEEIGQIMDIPHQVVSQHIHGIRRNGKRVGGAIAKIRKICEKRGIYLKEPRSAGARLQNLSENAVLI
jgi:DNA-directed RNA polymerase specialized sigma24 family protein